MKLTFSKMRPFGDMAALWREEGGAVELAIVPAGVTAAINGDALALAGLHDRQDAAALP